LKQQFNGDDKVNDIEKKINQVNATTTITIFYYFLCYGIGNENRGSFGFGLSMLVSLLAAARIFICFLPGNKWTAETPPRKYAIVRNIPLIALAVR
jgi:hypothetical protein